MVGLTNYGETDKTIMDSSSKAESRDENTDGDQSSNKRSLSDDESTPKKELKTESQQTNNDINQTSNELGEGKPGVSSGEQMSEEEKKELRGQLSRMCEPLECKLCQIKVDSPITAAAHYSGRRHKKKSCLFLKEPLTQDNSKKSAFTPINCEICSIILTSELHANQHYCGKAHLKRSMFPSSQNIVVVPERAPDPTGRFGIGVPDYPMLDPKNQSRFHCEVCNIYTTNAEQLEFHKKGSKHTKKVKNRSLTGKDDTSDLSTSTTSSDHHYCSECNLSSNSVEQFKQHVDGKKHKKQLKLLAAVKQLNSEPNSPNKIL